MKIEHISAKRLNNSFEVALSQLSPGFNVVLGNNDSGKSTIWEFLRDALCPPSQKTERAQSIAGTIGLRSGEKRAVATSSGALKKTHAILPSDLRLNISTESSDDSTQLWHEQLTSFRKPVLRHLFFASSWSNKSLTKLIATTIDDEMPLAAAHNPSYIGDNALVEKLCPIPKRQDSSQQNRSHQRLTSQLLQQEADYRRRSLQLKTRIKALDDQLINLKTSSQQQTNELDQLNNEIDLLKQQPNQQHRIKTDPLQEIDSQIRHISVVMRDLESSRDAFARKQHSHEEHEIEPASLETIERQFTLDLTDQIKNSVLAKNKCAECGQHHEHNCLTKWNTVKDSIASQLKEYRSVLTTHISSSCACHINAEIVELTETLERLSRRRSSLEQSRQFLLDEHHLHEQANVSLTVANEETPQIHKRRQELINQIGFTQNQQEQLKRSRQILQNQLTAAKQSFSHDEMRQRLKRSYSLLNQSPQLSTNRVKPKSTNGRLNELKQSKQYPAILADASIYLNKLTEGNFRAIRVNPDNQSVDFLHKSANWQSLESLSVGTQQMASLAFRLSIANAYRQRGIRFPFVFDNIFTDNDVSRQKTAINLISENCENGTQIILLTCHPSLYKKAVSLGAQGHHLAGRHVKQTIQQRATPTPVTTAPTTTHFRQSTSSGPTQFQRLHQEHQQGVTNLPNNVALQNELPKKPQANFQPNISTTEGNPQSSVRPRQHLLSQKSNTSSNTRRDYFTSQPHQYNSQSAIEKQSDNKTTHQKNNVASSKVEVTKERDDSKTFELAFDDAVSRLSFLNQSQRQQLKQQGITTVGEFLKIDQRTKQFSRQLNVTPSQLMRWQSATRLSYSIPGINQKEAELLAESGIHDAQSLAATTPSELQRRISWVRSLRNRSGRSTEFRPDNNQFRRWLRSAKNARSLPTEYRRSRRRTGSSNPSHNNTSRTHSFRNRSSGTSNRQRSDSRNTSTTRQSFSNQTNVRSTTTKSVQDRTTTASAQNATNSKQSEVKSELRYHLSRSAAVVDAPSIGPKTAKRLARAKIKTVADLLSADPETVAKKVNVSSIKADTLREWQAQAKLACCIPEIRGHDAQFLVACGVDNATKLSAYNPSDLFKVINPFARSKAGKRIARSGKLPDLAEVTDWIEWSRQARSIEAA